ncbi:hypothetical protein [Tenacibaculum agarivorans]|uniref:hypothetical protein n=1 Tax=Tenacibaculum agarivorans TaxID=1908389 RepID=UPI00094BB7ED|nr:hypothetical protein [Tenacibaculum agarivorans]
MIENKKFLCLIFFLACNIIIAQITSVDGFVGIIFDTGVASKEIKDPFSLYGLDFTSTDMKLDYDATKDEFTIYGTGKVTIAGDEVPISLGDSSSSGISITASKVDKANLTLTKTFSLKGLSITPNGLTFTLGNIDNIFKIYGDSTVSFNGNDIETTLGDADNPGIEVNNGNLVKINFGVSKDFTVSGIKFGASGLGFEYDFGNDLYKLFGSTFIAFQSEQIDISLGTTTDPGIEIKNGNLEKILAGITGEFDLKALTFTPDVLSFGWDKATDTFMMYGGASVEVASENVSLALGDQDNPGIEIKNGNLEKILAGITGEFDLKALTFTPGALSFGWDKVTDTFMIYGGASVEVASEEVDLALGDADNPGIEIKNGNLEKILAGITGEFDLKALTFTPDVLSFGWDKATDTFMMYGGASVEVTSEEVDLTLGDADNPGIEIKNGNLEKILAGITGEFDLKALTFTPDALSFGWDKATDTFMMYGGASVEVASENVDLALGDQDNPGIEIKNGNLEKILAGITGEFDLKALTFTPDALSFGWDKATDRFMMYGGASVEVASENVDLVLGDQDNPGIEIKNGNLEKILAGITGEFDLKALTFTPDALSFGWDKATDTFMMYGGASVEVASEEVDLALGDQDNPGIEIKNGNLEKILAGITGEFDLKALTFTPDALSFGWDKATDTFMMYGGASVEVASEEVDLALGDQDNPGIEIKNGNLEKILAGITGEFDLKALTFAPDALTFGWDKATDTFMMYGGASTTLASETVKFSFGDEDNPGVEVKNGNLQKIGLGITADFKISSMKFSPNDLSFAYDFSGNQFSMYGSGTFTVGSESIEFGMGTIDRPGTVVKNGNLQSINLSVTKEFTLNALTINPNPLGVQWDKNTKEFGLFGEMKLAISNQTLNASIGDETAPGIVVRNGNLKSFNATINSDFNMGGLEVKADDVNVEYSDSKYYFTGKVTVGQLWSASVDLGNDGGKGLEIDVSGKKNSFKINDFVIELQQIPLGAVSLQGLKVGFANGTIQQAAAMVSFPPGYEVGADLEFKNNPAKLDNIKISFEANSFDTAIPVGNTGIYIVYMDGSMNNLAKPNTRVTLKDPLGNNRTTSGIYFQGTVAFVFGGPASIGGRDAAFLYNRNTVYVTKDFAVLSADLLLGAYRAGNNDWKSQLGKGSIVMDLNWGNYYSINASMKIPSDPLVDFKLASKLAQNGSLGAKMDVKFFVPKKIPIIGGKKIGKASGALLYNPNDMNSSFAGAWVSYRNLKGKKRNAGAKYNFGKKKVDLMGNKGVNNLKDKINDFLTSKAPPGNQFLVKTEKKVQSKFINSEWEQKVYSFDLLERNATSMLFEADFDKKVDEVYVSVIGPEGFYDVHEVTVKDMGEEELPEITVGKEKTKYENTDKIIVDVINHQPEEEEEDYNVSLLVPGHYDLMIAYKKSNNVQSIDLKHQYNIPNHSGTIEVEENSQGIYTIDMTYWAHNPENAKISVYWNDQDNYNGYQIGTVGFGEVDEDGFGAVTLEFSAQEVIDEQELHFYFVIDDGDGVPVYSEITEAIIHESHVDGVVNVLNHNDEDGVHEGFLLYIDENKDGMYTTACLSEDDTFEKSIVSDEDGEFHFHNLEIGKEYTIGLVVPFGFELVKGETKSKTFIYQGDTINLEFNLNEIK